MSALAVAAVKLAETVVKSACEAATGSKLTGDLGGIAANLLGSRTTELREQRKATRALAEIASQVAEQIEAWFASEYRSISEDDRIVVVSAVTDTFSRAGASVDQVVSADLDPRGLEQRLRSATPTLLQEYALGDAEFLYDRILEQSCGAVVRLMSRMPDFQASAFGEVLSRLTTLATDLRDSATATSARLDMVERAVANATQPSLAELKERLQLLPVSDEVLVIERWNAAKEHVWQLVVMLTEPQTDPTDVLSEWQSDPPSWLLSAPPAARLVAAEFAAAYDAELLAAQLFESVALDGAPPRQLWYTRAALSHLQLDDQERAKCILDQAATKNPLSEPAACTLRAILDGDHTRAAQQLSTWQPHDTLSTLLHFALYVRTRLLADQNKPLNTELLDDLISRSRTILRTRWIGSIALAHAAHLVLRAELSLARYLYADLKEAKEFAIRVRDERRASRRRSSAEAVAVACRAALCGHDYKTVVTLGTPGSDGATATEGEAPEVRQHVLLARAALGDKTVSPSAADAVDDYTYATLKARTAVARGEDPVEHWREALAAAEDDNQRATTLMGLARLGIAHQPELEELAARIPELGREIQAAADLANGQASKAVGILRGLARTSPSAAATLAAAYDAQGDTDGFVLTLRQAAEDFHDQQFRVDAVLALKQADRATEARQELDLVLASAPLGWPGLANALHLGAQLAYDAGDLERTIELLRAAVENEPADLTTRWNLIKLLLERQEPDEAWQAYQDHPHLLEPQNEDTAHAWIELHREHGSAEAFVRGALQIMRRFPDSERLAAHALLPTFTPGRAQGPLPEGVLAELHAAMDSYFDRWPDSRHLRRIKFNGDLDNLREQINELVKVSAEGRRAMRALAAQVTLGEVPLAMLAAILHRTYAEVALRRGVDVLPAWHPHPAEHVACTQVALRAMDHAVVADTTSAVVLGLLPEPLRDKVFGSFQRILTTDSCLQDARAAELALSNRSRDSLVWDDQAQSARLRESSQWWANKLHDEALRLIETIRRLARRPTPAHAPGSPVSTTAFGTGATAFDLALLEGAPLWADDAALRMVARSAGLAVFSTPAVLDALAQRGQITYGELQEALVLLARERIGDIPLSGQQLLDMAEQEEWEAQSAAAILARPVSWANPVAGLERAWSLLRAVKAHEPNALPNWTYQCVKGAAYANTNNPEAASKLAGTILAVALHVTGAQGERVAELLGAARQALAEASHDPAQVIDPLPEAIERLHHALTRALNPEVAAQYMLAVASQLEGHDRQIAIQTILQL